MNKIFLGSVIAISLAACMPVKVNINKPNGSETDISFYPGGNTLDDLLIIDGKNYFGKAAYQMDDPMGDIGFTFNDGAKIRSECINKGKDIIGNDECKLYEVYRSNFELVPEGSKSPRPQLF
jgi:hypothetical protein